MNGEELKENRRKRLNKMIVGKVLSSELTQAIIDIKQEREYYKSNNEKIIDVFKRDIDAYNKLFENKSLSFETRNEYKIRINELQRLIDVFK